MLAEAATIAADNSFLFGIPLTAVAGLAVGYIVGEKAGRRAELERLEKKPPAGDA